MRVKRSIPSRLCARPGCGNWFEPPKESNPRRYCSSACHYADRPHIVKERVERICANGDCGKAFTPKWPSSRQRFCSRACRPHPQTTPEADRWQAKVDKTSSPNGCWIFLGRPLKGGHCHFVLEGGELILAHRYAWQLAHPDEAIPDDKVVCHDCPGGDNPACVNPAHLWLGTRAENNQDAARKGRSAKGAAIPHTKLNEQAVIEIRVLIAAKLSDSEIGRRKGVSGKTIAAIRTGKTWKHVA